MTATIPAALRRSLRDTFGFDELLDITLATRMPEEMRDALDQARNGILEALRTQPKG